jgi:beta-xylosidase
MLRLYAVQYPDGARNLCQAPNILMQKFPSNKFSATTKVTFNSSPNVSGETVGLIVMGLSYAYIGLKSMEKGVQLVHVKCSEAERGREEWQNVISDSMDTTVYLRVSVSDNSFCKFSYSFDGKNFTALADQFKAEPGKWIGAKFGLFCVGFEKTNDTGYADVDWVRVEPLD